MSYQNKGELLQAIISSLPYANQMHSLDLDAEPNAIRFFWRSVALRVELSGHVEEVCGRMLSGSDLAMVIQELIRTRQASDLPLPSSGRA